MRLKYTSIVKQNTPDLKKDARAKIQYNMQSIYYFIYIAKTLKTLFDKTRIFDIFDDSKK